jgi:hypothetical protein
LFEQRKLAAKEEIETADKMITAIRGAEARLNEEAERIDSLSEYVNQKDVDAKNKLDQAQELLRKARDMNASFEDEENQGRLTYETRMSLARERVIMLKERARERENKRSSKDIALVHRPARLTTDCCSMPPSFARALISIKDDINS